jgi:hypothetical protein
MAHNGGTPRLLAKCGSAVEVLDKQQIEDAALRAVARTTSCFNTALRCHMVTPLRSVTPATRRPRNVATGRVGMRTDTKQLEDAR